MIIRRPPDIPSSEITPEDVYVNRRRFIKVATAGAAGLAIGPAALGALGQRPTQEIPARFADMRSEQDEELTSYDRVTTYNNFLRVRHREGRPVQELGRLPSAPVDGHDRRRVQQAG